MKKKKEFLSYVSRHKQHYIWVALVLLFFVMSSLHATILGSIAIALVTFLPMYLLAEVLKHYLIPKFLHRNSWIYYIHSFFTIALLTVGFTFIEGYIYRHLYMNEMVEISETMKSYIQAGNAAYGYAYLHAKTLLLLTITLAVVTVSQLLDEKKRIEQESREHQMQLELKYLRAQINPHFLFNALNCIYSLTITQDETAPESVLKLSEMLRFVIDDCRADHVPIAKEVAYINNYIDFQKIRMERKPNICVEMNVENPSFAIPPMLFQPMVENCFKHSRIVDDPAAFVRISLCQKDMHVLFETENSKHSNGKFSNKDDERTGIGVQNVRQRLDLLFGKDYSLEISDDSEVYRTRLEFWLGSKMNN